MAGTKSDFAAGLPHFYRIGRTVLVWLFVFQAFVATGMMATIVFTSLSVRNIVAGQRLMSARIDALDAVGNDACVQLLDTAVEEIHEWAWNTAVPGETSSETFRRGIERALLAQWDGRRMAETGTGSGRSPTSPVREANAPNLYPPLSGIQHEY